MSLVCFDKKIEVEAPTSSANKLKMLFLIVILIYWMFYNVCLLYEELDFIKLFHSNDQRIDLHLVFLLKNKLKKQEPCGPGFLSLSGSPTRRSRGRGVTLWPVSPSFVRPRPLARALGPSFDFHADLN